jgi:predicted RNA-binding protein YlxR (DUF448 family)
LRTGRSWTRRPATTDDSAPPDAAEPLDEPERGPLRRCIVTRARLPRETMLRFVLGPDRLLVPDLAARLPGRGIWLSARGDVIEIARHRGGFAKAARGPVTIPADLPTIIQAGLSRRIVEFLGLARRAGQAVCGFQKAREWIQTGHAGLVVQALDGSSLECLRLLGGRDLPVIAPLPAATLALAFGRDHVVHVAVAKGRLAEALGVEAGRLAGVGSLAGGGAKPVGPDGPAARRVAGDAGHGIGFERAGA